MSAAASTASSSGSSRSSLSSTPLPLEFIAGATSTRPDPVSAYRSALTGKHILVTGGLGYIGSHTVVELVQGGVPEITIVDSLENSHEEVFHRIAHLTGGRGKIHFHQIDLRDFEALEKTVFQYGAVHFDACIHFAGLKAVGESVELPLKYWDYNVNGAIHLFKLLDKYHCRRVVFSSSATVYGYQEKCPIPETAPLSATNPYGQTKLTIEHILRDLAKGKIEVSASHKSGEGWEIVILRYFNPIGAHPTGLMGEDPRGIPNNLVPFVTQTAIGKRPHVNVFGNDYPTADGTGVRDYIHVVDLARGHLAALAQAVFSKKWLDKAAHPEQKSRESICEAFNLGCGSGSSVLEVIAAVEKACGHSIKSVFGPRRPGDVATNFSDPAKAQKELNWKTEFSLQDAISHSWKWQASHPEGYLTPNTSFKKK